jgi:hypothetical protein
MWRVDERKGIISLEKCNTTVFLLEFVPPLFCKVTVFSRKSYDLNYKLLFSGLG